MMRLLRLKRLTIILLCIAVPAPAVAGAWAPQPGSGYAKLWAKWLLGFGYHDGSGETISLGSYHEVAANAYGEFGLLPGLGIWLHAPLLQVFLLEDTRVGEVQSHFSPGDPTLGLTWQFLDSGRMAASFEVGARAPVADGEPVQDVFSAEGDKPQVGALRVGLGVWDVIAGLSWGIGFGNAYAAASLRGIYRTGDFDTVLTWSVEAGGNAGKWGLRGRLIGWHPLDNGTAIRHETPSGIANGTSYAAIVLEADYPLNDAWRVGMSVEGGVCCVRRQIGGAPVSLYFSTVY